MIYRERHLRVTETFYVLKNTKEPLPSTFRTLHFRKRCVILHPKRIYEHLLFMISMNILLYGYCLYIKVESENKEIVFIVAMLLLLVDGRSADYGIRH